MNNQSISGGRKLLYSQKRQLELDIAKGFAILCMIAVHVQSNLSHTKVIYSGFGGIIEFFGTLPAAPVFMFLLGTGAVYSRNNNLSKSIERGVKIFILGYILNILRTIIIFSPLILSGEWKIQLDHIIPSLISVDILQFAGLALIFIGVIKKLDLSIHKIIALAVVISSTNYVMILFKTENYIVGGITGILWGSSDWSSFPIITWIFYPLIGYCFGVLLKNAISKEDFYKKFLLYSGITLVSLIVVSIYFNIDTGLLTEASYSHHTLFNNFLYTSFVVTWISCLYYFSKISPINLNNMLVRWSKNVNSIYIIHWILISILVGAVGTNKFGFFVALIFFIIICTASDIIAQNYEKMNSVIKKS